MLADFLESKKERVLRTVEPRAAAEDPPGCTLERHRRLEALLDELTHALRNGVTGGPAHAPATGRTTAARCRDRELIRDEVIELIEQGAFHATPREIVTVSDWAWSAEYERLREHEHWLSVLLETLRAALASRDHRTAILSHDLRNPLGAAKMAAEALDRRPDLPEASRQQKVAVIKRATGRMAEMMDALLDFTRAQATGRLPISPRPVDLGTVVWEVTDEARTAHPDRAVEVDARGDLRGEWDPARMAQALSNLIGNAMAYGDPRTPVRVSADGQGPELSLVVKNDGPPIPSEVIPCFFEPFRRGARDASPHHLGLGLYIVKQIVTAHGGTIDVDSSAENGTTFTMRYPRTSAQATSP